LNRDEPELSTPPENGSETSRIQRWSAPECPFAIDYSTEVLTRIRQRAVEALHKLPHGGLEIGGLLFGRVMPNARSPIRVEIAAERPIECAHAAGPSFILAEEEIAGISAFLERSRFDAEIAALSAAFNPMNSGTSSSPMGRFPQQLNPRLNPRLPYARKRPPKPRNTSPLPQTAAANCPLRSLRLPVPSKTRTLLLDFGNLAL
jgi:hypothetical protein